MTDLTTRITALEETVQRLTEMVQDIHRAMIYRAPEPSTPIEPSPETAASQGTIDPQATPPTTPTP